MPSRKAPGGPTGPTRAVVACELDRRRRQVESIFSGFEADRAALGPRTATLRRRPAMDVRFVILAPARRKGSVAVRLPLLVGRADDAKFRITQDCVSRRHCEFLLEDDVVVVRDLGSTNGTYLDGERLPAREPVRVRPGAEIRIGEVAFQVDYAASQSADLPAPRAASDADTVPLDDAVAPPSGADLPTLEPAADDPEPPIADAEPAFPIAADAEPAAPTGSFDFLPAKAAPPPAADDDNLNDFFKSLS